MHLSVPSDIFSGEDLIQTANIAQRVEGAIRLSVEQSLYKESFEMFDTRVLSQLSIAEIVAKIEE